nr:hypothetical protein [Tanacetum cinerariifolium]
MMHDGVVRTLTDVCHVPDLKKNLISLGVLDSKGFKYTSKNGVLRVSKGALVVMKASKGTSSFYTLQGETIIGSASVSCLEKSNSDLTKLWHMRLGHMSEKGMVILSKQGLLDKHKGPYRVPSLGGARYNFSIIDNFSRMKWVFMMKHKKSLMTFVEMQGLQDIIRFVTLLSKTRSPATAINRKTSIEVWSGKPADYSKLHVFRCLAYYHVSEGKLDPRCEKGIFMGYDPIESKLKDGVSGKVEDVPKQVKHVVLGDMDHDDTSLHEHTILHIWNMSKIEEVEALELDTYQEAITSKDSDMWIVAMGKVLESLDKNKTWELVQLAERRKVVGSHHDLELERLDVKTAFLHGDLEEEIYMSQPEGFVVQGKEDYVSAKDMEEVKMLKILLNTEFDMKDLGVAQKILGMEIIQDQKH